MKLLLPLDGSDCAHGTLEWAAKTFDPDAEYYLLYVIPVLPDLNAMEFDIVDAMAVLKKARTELQRQGCTVANAEYVLGDTVAQICAFADEMDVDQVVIGTHGRTGLSRLLMGSVGTGVLERCKRPVVLFRNLQPVSNEDQTHAHLLSNTVL